MKKTVIYFLLMVLSVSTRAQGLYEVSPLSGSKDSVESFFERCNKPVKNKFLYVIYLNPSGCPRCEALINPFIDYMIKGKHCSVDDIVMIVNYEHAKVAMEYFKKNDFNTKNVIVDQSGRFFDYFSNNTNVLKVPYLYKFNKDYELLKFSSFLGMEVNDSFATAMEEDVIPMEVKYPVVESIEDDKAAGRPTADYDNLDFVREVELEQNDKAMPSKALSIYYNMHTNRIAWLDYVMSAVYVYDEKGNFIEEFEPTDAEFEKFSKIDISASTYNMLKQSLLKVIYLKVLGVDNEQVQLVGSLPRLSMKVAESGDTLIDYANQICLIDKGIQSQATKVSMIDFPKSLEEKGFFTKHVNIYKYDSTIILPLYKGWPVIGSKNFNDTDYRVSYNPFVDSFYDEVPLFYVINTNDNSIKVVGELSDKFKRSKSGYYNYKPRFIAYNRHLYFYDGYSDYFLVYDTEFRVTDTLYCFSPGESLPEQQRFDSRAQKPLDYLNTTRAGMRNKIVDLKIVDGRLLVLYEEEGGSILLNNYNLDSKVSTIYKVDDIMKSNSHNKYAISSTNDKALITKVSSGSAKISFTDYIKL